ncbi:MAG: ABC transporter substrate-binding protein [Flavobacteriaceae bacterium]|nr:ABC transporter substrate-binding protein [Flavobacteriaceae bacterium]
MTKSFLYICIVFILLSCKQPQQEKTISAHNSLEHAKGFTYHHQDGIQYISVTKAWPESKQLFHYMLAPKNKEVATPGKDTLLIRTPIEKVVVMSTTNIPPLELIEEENSLVAFPNTNYISSEITRKRIDSGKIKDIGTFGNFNMELLLQEKPDLIIGFSVNGNNATYDKIEKFGIPVVFDGSWTEAHPLGRAEWIKFIAAFFEKTDQANQVFREIETAYLQAKEKAAKVSQQPPTVLSGSMYKDVWYVPGGQSFAAQILQDANTNYYWKDNTQTGSIALSFESVLAKAKKADLWISAGNFTSKEQLIASDKSYAAFDAFTNNKIYSFAHKKGATGGFIYYELGPMRPDLILQDIIKIGHPNLLPAYEPFFFRALE